MYIISACLTGENVKYNGGNNYCLEVVDFLKGRNYVLVCPEVLGGLSIPRDPCERTGDRVMDRGGKDVTEAFYEGARRCLEEVLEKVPPEDIEGAILRKASPSCGSGLIYDGTFSGTKIPGDGVFTALLKEHGIRVFTEDEITEIDDKGDKQ